MASWHLNSLASWHLGILISWHLGFLASWNLAILASWHLCFMASWHLGLLAFTRWQDSVIINNLRHNPSLLNFLKFRWKMEAVVLYLTYTPAPEVPAIQMSTLPPKMTMGLDFLISFSFTSSSQTFFFYFGPLAPWPPAPSPLAPGPSSPGPAAPGHPTSDLKLLDLTDFQLFVLQLQDHNCFLLD